AFLSGYYSSEPVPLSPDDRRADLRGGCVLVARLGAEVVGSVRGVVDEKGTAAIGKLIVHPRMQRHGLGGRLLAAIEGRLTEDRAAKRYRLFTGHRSEGNLRLYRRYGYAQVGTEEVNRRLSLVTMEKDATATAYAASA
ncbi:GNAT family N-acetyltransferase, partial [Streptomyces sp. NPDC059426]|uniref:GNAT family N-acetyltransferase n=1 Tax=Streptomyces sp. NPDC059426 TaxID=3346827 RepID=UPI0036B18D48